MLLFDAAGNDGGAAGQTVFAEGGPGAVSEALAAAARAAGAEIRCGAEVAAIISRDGRVTGVALASGEEIEASTVVSGLDPKRTLVGLCDPVAVGPSMLWRAGNIRTPGVVSKVNLVRRPAAAVHRRGRRRRDAAPRPDRRRARHRRDRAGVRRVEVRPGLRRARPRGDDPLARRPVARRGRAGRDARRERHRPVHAVRAPRRLVGRRGARPGRRRGRGRGSTRSPRAWPRA